MRDADFKVILEEEKESLFAIKVLVFSLSYVLTFFFSWPNFSGLTTDYFETNYCNFT